MSGILMSRNTRSGGSRSTIASPSGAGRRQQALVAFVLEDHPQRVANGRFVVDHQNPRFHVRQGLATVMALAAADYVAELGLADLLTPSVSALSSLLPASRAGNQRRRLLADRRRHLGAEPLQRRLRLVAGHRFQRAGDDEGLPGQRPGAVRLGARRSVMSTPAVASARPVDGCTSSSKPGPRTDCATTGPTSWTRSSSAERRVARSPCIERNARGQRRGAALADMADAEREEQARQRRPAWLLLDLARPGSPPTSCPSARARPAVGGQRIEIGEALDQADASRADRPAIRRAPRCSSRGARRNARGCAAAAPDSDVFSQRQTASSSSLCSGVSQIRARRRHHPRLAARRHPRPRAAAIGFTTLRDDLAGLLDQDDSRRGGCPCARSPARCAASPSAPSCPRGTPARARRTASPRRCGRRSP